jgi:DNA/RNA-binding domain of Phe-tRNA-synthetase-like protein
MTSWRSHRLGGSANHFIEIKEKAMSTTKFEIAKDVLEKFPALTVAAVRVQFPDPAQLKALLPKLAHNAQEAVRRTADIEPIAAIPEIGCWRDAYAQIGVKPSKFQSSIEALMRRQRKGDLTSTGIDIVDFYNSISIASYAPMGAYDADKVAGQSIELRFAVPGSDRFDPLGGDPSSFPLTQSLVIYASQSTVLCWGFSTRDSKDACVDGSTRNVLFFSEMVDGRLKENPLRAMKKLSSHITGDLALASEVQVFDTHRSMGFI